MAALWMLTSAAPGEALELAERHGPLRKLGRGVANVVTSPGEVYVQGMAIYQRYGLFACASWGMVRGLFRMFTRAGAGLVEVATFPLPLWAHGYRPLIEPEFFWMPATDTQTYL